METVNTKKNTVKMVVRDSVATITLARPESKNALSREMAQELLDCLAEIRSAPDIRAVILTGAAGNFCSGGDMRHASAGVGDARSPVDSMELYRNLSVSLISLDLPVVAAVDGVAYGAGFSLALLCDFVLVSDRVRMCMVFHRMGRIPDLAAYFTLPRIVGLARARELIYSAREVGAQEALNLGIAIRIVRSEALPEAADDLASALAAGPPIAMRISKKALGLSSSSSLEAMLLVEGVGQSAASSSDFAKEAGRRFLAKEVSLFRLFPQ